MNKWSKSLPSINTLPDDAKFNSKPIRIPQTKLLSSIKSFNNATKLNSKPLRIPATKALPNDDSDSLTDVSLLSPTKPSSVNYERTTKYYNAPNQFDSVIEIDAMSHNEFVPVDQLYDSLFAYANSFHIDETPYSSTDITTQTKSPPTIKQQSEPTTNYLPANTENNNNNNLTRHRSCEDILQNNKPSTFIKHNSNELLPTHMFSQKKFDQDDNDNHSDESTTVTEGSKFQWEYLSDSKDQTNKSSINLASNYQVKYSQDIEQHRAGNYVQKVSLSPIIIREKIEDLFIQQKIDIRVLRQPTSPLPTTPIIIREILHRPSPSKQFVSKHYSPPCSSTPYTEYNRSSKPPIVPKIRQQPEHDTTPPSKEIIIEYNQVNVTVAKNINQREEIKRINPDQYIQQHGSSLYSNDVFHDILSNIIS